MGPRQATEAPGGCGDARLFLAMAALNIVRMDIESGSGRRRPRRNRSVAPGSIRSEPCQNGGTFGLYFRARLVLE